MMRPIVRQFSRAARPRGELKHPPPPLPSPQLESWRAWPEPSAAIGTPVHIDKHLLCINKPAGILSQPDITKEACATQITTEWLGSSATCVHRLDKWATGCLLLARTKRAAKRLGLAFADQHVTKHYLVIVRALRNTAPPQAGSSGRVERHLSVGKGGWVHVDRPTSSKSKARSAVLTWSALASERTVEGGRHALLCIGLRGGFKHQIRALLGAEGLPLLGDALYGGEPCASHESLIALHAATLQLAHPIGGHAPLMLRAPLPAAWTEHALPPAMVEEAKRVLDLPIGHGPLWAHRDVRDGQGRAGPSMESSAAISW